MSSSSSATGKSTEIEFTLYLYPSHPPPPKMRHGNYLVPVCMCNPRSQRTNQRTKPSSRLWYVRTSSHKKSWQLLLFSWDSMCLRPLNRKPATSVLACVWECVCVRRRISFRVHHHHTRARPRTDREEVLWQQLPMYSSHHG